MPYVDGFVIPVAQDKLDLYKKIAKVACKVWMEYGALQYMECVGDDVSPDPMSPGPKLVQFPKMAKAKEGEVVMFSWILFKSRADRDRINAKVMKDPRIASMCKSEDQPFDCKRMAYGGFKTIVQGAIAR